VTRWYETCSHTRRRRRRIVACDEHAKIRSCEPAAMSDAPKRRYFVEGPIDAAHVLLEERRAGLSLISLTAS
jgi:hypothetical protein